MKKSDTEDIKCLLTGIFEELKDMKREISSLKSGLHQLTIMNTVIQRSIKDLSKETSRIFFEDWILTITEKVKDIEEDELMKLGSFQEDAETVARIIISFVDVKNGSFYVKKNSLYVFKKEDDGAVKVKNEDIYEFVFKIGEGLVELEKKFFDKRMTETETDEKIINLHSSTNDCIVKYGCFEYGKPKTKIIELYKKVLIDFLS